MRTAASLHVQFIRTLTILVIGLLGLLPRPSIAADTTPLAFLQELYAHYEKSDKGVDIGSPAERARYFTARLADLIEKDIRESKKRDEVGRLDMDPFIGGQEWAPTKIELKAEPGAKPDQATGSASFTPPGEKDVMVVTLALVKTAAGWRIADIHWKGQTESLLTIMTKKF